MYLNVYKMYHQDERVKIMRRNMLPYYHPRLALISINDISSLTTCQRLEVALHYQRRLNVPSFSRNLDLQEADLAVKPVILSVGVDDFLWSYSLGDSYFADRYLKWKCSVIGHRRVECC